MRFAKKPSRTPPLGSGTPDRLERGRMLLDSPGLPKRLEDEIRTIVDGFDAQCAERELKAEQVTREQAMKVQAAKHDAEVQEARHAEQMVEDMMKHLEALARRQFLDRDDEHELARHAAEIKRLRNETARIVQKVLDDPKRFRAALEKADIFPSKVRGVESLAGVSHRKNDRGRGASECDTGGHHQWLPFNSYLVPTITFRFSGVLSMCRREHHRANAGRGQSPGGTISCSTVPEIGAYM